MICCKCKLRMSKNKKMEGFCLCDRCHEKAHHIIKDAFKKWLTNESDELEIESLKRVERFRICS